MPNAGILRRSGVVSSSKVHLGPVSSLELNTDSSGAFSGLPGVAVEGASAASEASRGGLSLQEQRAAKEAALIGKTSEEISSEGQKAYLPKYVRACQKKLWTVALWPKRQPYEKRFVCYACRSWRCQGDCLRRNKAQWFARIKSGFDRLPGSWVFLTLTFDRRSWSSERACFLGAYDCWRKLRKRFVREFGKVVYVACVEQHRSGWPHFHVAIRCDHLASACAGDGWRSVRKTWLKPALAECGFGYVVDLSPARSPDAIAGYIVKAAGEASALPGELAKGSQVPVNAPKGFRRIRASHGFLPKKIKNTEITGQLIFAPQEEVHEAVVRGCERVNRRAEARAQCPQKFVQSSIPFGVDVDTGEVVEEGAGCASAEGAPSGRHRAQHPRQGGGKRHAVP